MSTLDVVTQASVRDLLAITDTTREWSTGIIGSNILVASARLQRVTNRQWEPQTAATKLFSTEGRDSLAIPDLRSATAVTLNSATLTADSTYYLLPSRPEPTIYIGIQFPRLKGRSSILAYSDWYDRGLDLPDFQRDIRRGVPNDLSIAGDWGRLEAAWPIEVVQAIRALAAFLTIHASSALLSGAKQTPEGNVFDLSRWPLEVQAFVKDWANFDQMVVAG